MVRITPMKPMNTEVSPTYPMPTGFLQFRRAILIFTLLMGTWPNLDMAWNAQSASPKRPNIVVILVDDMGFSDLGAYGSEIPTPNLDRLAKQGKSFSQFYNTGRCCPTRASLLTGLYSHQAGMGWMTNDQGAPGYRGHLNEQCVTIADVLGEAGYFTAMTGKWHVGSNHGVQPWNRGFQRSLNLPAGGVYYGSTLPKCELHLNGEKIDHDDPRLPRNWYGTDLWTDYGIRFIDEARESGKPFFLYLAHVAPHFPLQASAEDIARFRGQYKSGWDQLSRERHQRQIDSGLINRDWKAEPRPEEIQAWNTLSAEEQDRMDHIMAVYAAVVSRMDASVGRLVQALKDRGELENTLILFMSDNGGNAESGPAGRNNGDPTQADSNWFCGRSWAHLQNTPFREYKHYNHEGGIASPLIAHWPGKIQAGQWVRTPAHIIDIMATCVDVAGATYPKSFREKPILPMEGASLKPLLLTNSGDNFPVNRSLFWEHEGNAAMRQGDWKLVRKGLRGPWELFRLNQDRTEQVNLAEAQPERLASMRTEWQAWARRVQAMPKPGATEKPKAANNKKKAGKKQP